MRSYYNGDIQQTLVPTQTEVHLSSKILIRPLTLDHSKAELLGFGQGSNALTQNEGVVSEPAVERGVHDDAMLMRPEVHVARGELGSP